MKCRACIVTAAFCVLVQCAQVTSSLAQPSQSTSTKLLAQVNAYLEPYARTHYFSGTVLIAQGSTVLLDRGYGLADEAKGIKDGPNTVFPIGSMTKAFTAVAILQLQDEHKLSVSDRLCGFVSRCPKNWAGVTVDELLTMTSGLRDFSFIPDEDMTSPSRAFAYVGHQAPVTQPGATWSYNDFGYRLLGFVVQKVSGESYDAYIRSHIFKVLGMRHSSFYSSLLSTPHHALPYASNRVDGPIAQHPAGAWQPGMNFFDAAGGIISTANDLYRWNRALDTAKLISKAELRTMFRAHVTTGNGAGGPPFSAQYGYGWFVDKVFNQAVDQHRGGAGPYWGYTFRFPQAHRLIIALSNRPDSDGDLIMTNLTRIVLGKTS